MRLEQIEYFLAVAEHGNITTAARSLFISQPALSKQINLLEEELGVRLLERNARGVTLTLAGKHFRGELREILDRLEYAKHETVEIGNSEGMPIRLGCFDGALMDDFLPGFCDRIQERAPGTTVQVVWDGLRELKSALAAGKIAMLLTLRGEVGEEEAACRQKTVSARQRALIYSARSPLAAKEHPTPADFNREILFLINRDSAPGMFERNLRVMKSTGLKPRQIEQVNNFSTLLSAVRLGHGFSILTEAAQQHYPDLISLPVGDDDGADIVAVWRPENEFIGLLMSD